VNGFAFFPDFIFEGMEIPKYTGAGFDMPGFDLKEQVNKLDEFLAEI
jgi:hypothetical protein